VVKGERSAEISNHKCGVKLYLQETGFEGKEFIYFAQDIEELQAFGDTALNLGIPYKMGYFFLTRGAILFSCPSKNLFDVVRYSYKMSYSG
jgi:hypothetical protein